MKKNIGKSVGNVLFYLILIILIAISVVSIRAKKLNKQPSIMGYKFFNVLTGSMEPTIMVGDLIVVKEIDSDEVKIGDVITFGSSNTSNVTTHRVVNILSNGDISFVTRGDANNADDPVPVEDELVVGKVVCKLSNFGQGITFFQENLIVIVLGVIVIFGGFYIVFRKRK